ncbi:MAG TPA: hypothetical protein VMY78_09110 [Solirubrobacteraceae bacterium]|nr:hypothetical protein [Solirubrobacteraceae bacterium]
MIAEITPGMVDDEGDGQREHRDASVVSRLLKLLDGLDPALEGV